MSENPKEENSYAKICKCDEECTMYGDCCFDKAKEKIQNKASTFRSAWECRHFSKNVSIRI